MGADASAAQAILEELVAFDTTSHKTNLPLIAYVREYLSKHDVDVELIHDASGQKANLFATIGPAGISGVGLSGHTDVVPVEGQIWATDPFRLTERDGRLYGRGACDMKGFLACSLAAVPMFQARKLSSPIHILFSYDEEVGCTGVRPMIAELGERLTAPRIIIVGEPTSMRVVDAHKGACRFETLVTGREAHSSMSHIGVNAIQYAGELIAQLRRIEADLPRDERAERFTPPLSTVHVGTIEGGTAMNIVPKRCKFNWEVRPLPGATSMEVLHRFNCYVEEDVLPRMHAVDGNADVVTQVSNDIPAFDAGPESKAVSLAHALAGQNQTFAVSYMTEAAWFQDAGHSTVVCGPGDIAQAHTPDEFVEIAQLEKCMGFMQQLAAWATT